MLVCWLNHRPLQVRQKYIIRHTTDELQGFVTAIDYKVNINTLENNFDDKAVGMNDIAKVTLIFIAEGTNETVGAGMIVE